MSGCANEDAHFLQGAEKYTDKSPVCVAALHSGAINSKGGKF